MHHGCKNFCICYFSGTAECNWTQPVRRGERHPRRGPVPLGLLVTLAHSSLIGSLCGTLVCMHATFGWLDALILGLVQGLTEFLPISSSTQLGTELAVLIYFRRDVGRMLLAWWRSLPTLGRQALDVDAKVAWLVMLGTLPICVLGLLLRDAIETTFRTLTLTALMLIVFGMLLGWAEKRGHQARSIAQLTVKDGILLGLAQAMALVPGVSRSGGTISVGLLLGLTR